MADAERASRWIQCGPKTSPPIEIPDESKSRSDKNLLIWHLYKVSRFCILLQDFGFKERNDSTMHDAPAFLILNHIEKLPSTSLIHQYKVLQGICIAEYTYKGGQTWAHYSCPLWAKDYNLVTVNNVLIQNCTRPKLKIVMCQVEKRIKASDLNKKAHPLETTFTSNH